MSSKPVDAHGTETDPSSSAWNWWQELINYERRQASSEDLKLHRIGEILHFLDNPHLSLKCFHVAGTKGKGSVCAYLDSILRHGGHKVGLFTSPHLETINERFAVNGYPISNEDLCKRILEVRDAARAIPGEPPTFFEVATAAGFLHFRHSKVDWVVLETGLGGRLDSTNVCVPVGCAISSISLDHTKQLGETVEQIAGEKAGILKSGIPAVSGVRESGPKWVIHSQAKAVDALLWEIDKEVLIYNENKIIDSDPPGLWKFDLRTPRSTHAELTTGLPGRHQVDNAALAVALLEQVGVLPEVSIVRSGLRKVQWPCRVETIIRHPWIILDTAHNVASVKALTEALFSTRPQGKSYLVFAASQDKDINGMLAHLAGLFDRIHLTRYSGGLRSAAPEFLFEALPIASQKNAIINENPTDCLESIISTASQADLICITGSVFLAGELKPWLNSRFPQRSGG